ncbi:MAG: trimethylamine methyltransferase family protein [Paracoccaceae bacterium]
MTERVLDEQRPKRRGRAVKREGPQVADAFHLGSRPGRSRARVLGDGQIAELRDRALELLDSYGVVVIHPGAQAALRKAGARPGSAADRFRLPRDLVEEALRETPKAARLCGKRAARDMVLPRGDGQFVMRTGTGGHGYVDPRDARYRNMDRQAAREIAAVAEGWGRWVSWRIPSCTGCPRSAPTFTPLPRWWGGPPSMLDPALWQGECRVPDAHGGDRGGGEAELRARPIASCITCSFTPLEFKYMDTECIIQAGRWGIPLHACSLPSAGGSAPLTPAGMVLMAAAEIVAMVVLAHVLSPGTPVIATPLMFTLDMATGRALQSCPEVDPDGGDGHSADEGGVRADGAYLWRGIGHAGCRPAVDGRTGALGPGGGAGRRRYPGRGRAARDGDGVQPRPGGAGRRAGRDDPQGADPAGYQRRGDEFRRGAGVRVGGHFLDSAQTLALCREQHVPGVFLRQGRDDYEKSNRRTAFEAARERALDLIAAAPEEGYLSADQRREIAEVVAAGEKVVIAATSGKMDVI